MVYWEYLNRSTLTNISTFTLDHTFCLLILSYHTCKHHAFEPKYGRRPVSTSTKFSSLSTQLVLSEYFIRPDIDS